MVMAGGWLQLGLSSFAEGLLGQPAATAAALAAACVSPAAVVVVVAVVLVVAVFLVELPGDHHQHGAPARAGPPPAHLLDLGPLGLPVGTLAGSLLARHGTTP